MAFSYRYTVKVFRNIYWRFFYSYIQCIRNGMYPTYVRTRCVLEKRLFIQVSKTNTF
ncbi:hypothetical protein C2G38_2068627, partial [Gigaspora rosea]